MVSQLKKSRPLVMQLHLSKVSEEHIKPYQRQLDELFSEPSKYFMSDWNRTKVLIGKNSCRIGRKSLIATPKKRMNTQVNASRSRRSSQSFAKALQNASSIYKTHQLPPNKSYINDYEVNSIFERYREIKERNMLMSVTRKSSMTKDKSVQLSGSPQQRALENYSKFKRDNKRLTDLISRKVKKKEDNFLLMMNTNAFRIKRELREKKSSEAEKKLEGTFQDWVVSLRNKNDQHYINAGTNNNPIWQIIRSKRENANEIIRDNEENADYERSPIKPASTEAKSSHDNKFNSSLMKYQNTATALQLKGLIIQGNDLLNTEYNHFRKMKGRKIITKMARSEENSECERVFINSMKHPSKYSFG